MEKVCLFRESDYFGCDYSKSRQYIKEDEIEFDIELN